MKPNLTITNNNRRQTFPNTDYSYTVANVAEFRSTSAKRATGLRSFRKISEDYFKHEAPPSFLGEVAFFGLITVTASLPIFHAAIELGHFLRAVAL